MRNVWILTVSMGALAVCYTMLVPFLPVYLMELNVAEADLPLWSGLIFSVTFFVAGVMAPIWGRMADNRGKKMMAIRASVCIGISYALMAFVTDVWQLLFMRAFQGFANGFLPAAMTMVSLSVPQANVGVALGIFQTGMVIGNVIGPFIGGTIAAQVGMRPAFVVAGGVLFIVSLIVAFFVKEPTVEELTEAERAGREVTHGGASLREDWHEVRKNRTLSLLIAMFFIVQGGILMLQPMLALYIGEMEGTMDRASVISGTILSVGGLFGVITTNLWARFGQAKGYFNAISSALTVTGIALFLQGFEFGIWWFGALQIIIGCCFVGVNPALSAAITTYTDPHFRGRVFGMTTTAQMMGSMTGPLLASFVTMMFGIRFVFLAAGILFASVGVYLYRNYRTK